MIQWNDRNLFPTFNQSWDHFFSKDFFDKGMQLGTSIPAANISETIHSFTIEMAIPGGKKEDFDLHLDKDILTISSQKKEEKEEKEEKGPHHMNRKEFSYASFERSFQIPKNVEHPHIEASYEDGILKIVLPKLEPKKIEEKKRIEIK